MFSRFETMYLLALSGLKVKTHELKRSGSRTEWSTNQGVIRRVIMINQGWNIYQNTKFLLNQLPKQKHGLQLFEKLSEHGAPSARTILNTFKKFNVSN